MIAVYAGSFSPPTKGHLDIIRRSAKMFDQLVVAVLSQEAKRYLFSPEERKEMLSHKLGLKASARTESYLHMHSIAKLVRQPSLLQ